MADTPAPTAQTPAAQNPETPGSSRKAGKAEASTLDSLSARFWCEFMFFCTEHWPWFVRASRGFFLWFTWRFATGLRQGLLANARRLLGPDADSQAQRTLARKVLYNFYTTIYELGKSVRQSRATLAARTTKIVGEERYIAARKEKRGAIIATAHLGPFEIGAAALMDREKRVHVIYQKDISSRFDRLRSMLRTRLGITEASLDAGWSMWIKLRDALQANEVVVIQADRVMPGQQGIEMPFLGGHLCLPTGPYKLAIASGAPIIPVFSIPDPDHPGCLKLMIEEPIDVVADLRDKSDSNAPEHSTSPVFLSAMARLTSLMEHHIKANPESWMMLEAAWCEDQDEARKSSQTSGASHDKS